MGMGTGGVRRRHLWLWPFMLCTALAAEDYKYIECFQDSTSDRDLGSREIGTVDLPTCASECRSNGDAYMGLQAGSRCYCGQRYGKHGTTRACNYTCEDVRCGGVLSNDVYYTADVDAATEALRVDVAYTTPATFDNARKKCVQNNGDLVTVTSATASTRVLDVIKQANVTTGDMWIGLRRQPTDDVTDDFAWTMATIATYSSSAFSSYWASGETQQKPCVVIDIADGTWTTVSCTAVYVYVCHQLPSTDADATSDTADGASKAGEEDTSNIDSTKLSLYIVLPLFILCYGGSCVLYCSHKLYKSFRRRKRQKMLLTRMEQEYEPHNKPKYVPPPQQPPPPVMGMPGKPHPGTSPRPFSPNRRAVVAPAPFPVTQQRGMAFSQPAPMPVTAVPPPPKRNVTTPVQNIRIPSPQNEAPQPPPPPKKAEEQPAKKADDLKMAIPPTPPEDALYAGKTTSRDVEIELSESASPRPDSQSHPVGPGRNRPMSVSEKQEARRTKLLNQALAEARTRRRQEEMEKGGPQRPNTVAGKPKPHDDGAATPPPPPVLPPGGSGPPGEQWATRRDRRNKKYREDADSGDSSTNLLSDGSSPDSLSRDPTNMSIQEILRMKVAARSSKRRAKKILSA